MEVKMVLEKKKIPGSEEQRFTVIRGSGRRASGILDNLMRDTSAPILIILAERYGLRRVPGLAKDELITRILRHLSPEDLKRLEQELIAARYGALPVEDLLNMALEQDAQRLGRPGKPRLDQISVGDATLVEGGTLRWVYTMRGHDVEIDLTRRHLGCDCAYFAFASRRKALCKHLATAFRLIPEVYAREALIDLLVARDYGGDRTVDWRFKSPRAA
jgi:hypothetical protein